MNPFLSSRLGKQASLCLAVMCLRVCAVFEVHL